MKTSKTMKIALGGICLALTVIFLFGGSIVPGIELTLFAISSLFTAVMILETGVKGGVLLYAGAVLLGFAIIPNKLAMIPYAFFFGYYGIVKYYIEKASRPLDTACSENGTFRCCSCPLALIGFKKLLLGKHPFAGLPSLAADPRRDRFPAALRLRIYLPDRFLPAPYQRPRDRRDEVKLRYYLRQFLVTANESRSFTARKTMEAVTAGLSEVKVIY